MCKHNTGTVLLLSEHDNKRTVPLLFAFYVELTGDAASKNRDTQYYQQQPYMVKGFWRHRTWGEGNERHENSFYNTDIQTLG